MALFNQQQRRVACTHCGQEFGVIFNPDIATPHMRCVSCNERVWLIEPLPPLHVNTIRHQYLHLAIRSRSGINDLINVIAYLIYAINAPVTEPDDEEAIRLLEECKRLYRNGDIAATSRMRALLDRIERANPLLYELMESV